MKIKQIILFTLIITNSIGCINSKKEDKTPKEEKIKTTVSDTKIITPPKDCGMDFESFFAKFSSDNDFQIRRIKFPLKMIYFDIYGSDQTTPIEEYIKLQDYEFFDLSDDEKAKDKETDKFEIKIEKNGNDSYLYYQLGIDNGINVEFKFKKENDCWLLFSIKDEST